MSSPINKVEDNLKEVQAALEEISTRLYIDNMPCDEAGCLKNECPLWDPEFKCLQDLCDHIINNWGKY